MKRADIYRWAATLGGAPSIQPSANPFAQDKKPIKVIDLPGVRTLEDKLILYGADKHRAEEMVAFVSRQLFGLADADFCATGAGEYDEYYEDGDELDPLTVVSEAAFAPDIQTGSLADDEAMEALLLLGLDFSDDRGKPLRCTKLMCRPAEAAAKGIAGKLPDLATAENTRWEEKLVRSRDAFIASRRKRNSG